MTRIFAAALALAALGVTAPASAQAVRGGIHLAGHVTGGCRAVRDDQGVSQPRCSMPLVRTEAVRASTATKIVTISPLV